VNRAEEEKSKRRIVIRGKKERKEGKKEGTEIGLFRIIFEYVKPMLG